MTASDGIRSDTHEAEPELIRSRFFNFYILTNIIVIIFGFVIQVTLVKSMKIDEYVIFIIFLSIVLLGTNIIHFGVNRTIFRYLPIILSRSQSSLLLSTTIYIRIFSITIFFICALFSAYILSDSHYWPKSSEIIIGGTVWFLSVLCFADASAWAQARMMHGWLAIVMLTEALLRLASIIVLLVYVGADRSTDIILVYAATSSFSFIALTIVLASFSPQLHRHISSDQRERSNRVAINRWAMVKFATAYHASALGAALASPAAVRLVAAPGLTALPLAAFSFQQGLFTSLQRVLPGRVIVPSLEALILADTTTKSKKERSYPSLSVLFKFEMTSLLFVAIICSISGDVILTFLSRSEFAPYYPTMVALTLLSIVPIIYKILETIAAIEFMHSIFLRLWPLSILALCAIYYFTGSYGIIGIIVVLILESIVRIGILAAWLRSEHLAELFDLRRTCLIVLTAAVAALAGFIIRKTVWSWSDEASLVLCAAIVALWLCAVFLLRPLRPKESLVLKELSPRRWKFLMRLIDGMTCRATTSSAKCG